MADGQPSQNVKRKSIDLALQGGGAHGAFAWGILDYLLEDGRIDFSCITAASAGAMNAAVMTYGLAVGGREAARESLHNFWQDISHSQFTVDSLTPHFMMDMFPHMQEAKEWFSYLMMGSFTHAVSPYQFNPMNLNPLKDILERNVNFDVLREAGGPQLFISATNVRTCKVKVFACAEVTADAVIASACLPNVFQAVEIGGEFYWDGGFSGNPPLWPLFYDRGSRDVLVVLLNPIERLEIPKTAAEIHNRMNEISFNSSLLQEMRAVSFVQKLIGKDMLKDEYKDHYVDILFHNIRADRYLQDLSVATKYNTDWTFLKSLRDRGRSSARSWLNMAYDKLGVESTVSLRDEFFEANPVALKSSADAD